MDYPVDWSIPLRAFLGFECWQSAKKGLPYDAACCLVRSWMLRLLTCCCQNMVDYASEPYSKTETTRARYRLMLVLMLMRCLRNSGFDRPYMATSFVIRDPRYVKESANYFHVAYLQWQMVGVGRGDSHVFGLWPADLECMVTISYQ